MSGGGGGGGRGGGGGGGGCRGHPGGGGADDAAEVYDDSGRNPGEVGGRCGGGGGRGGGGGGGGCRGHHGGGGADDAAEVYDDSGRNPGEVVDRLVSRGCTSTAVKRRNSKKNAQARSRLPDERLLSDQYSRFPLESQQQSDPFEGGSFDMDLLFKEFDNDEKDDVTLCYARYCALRAQARLSDKDKDICYICHFKHNKVTPLPKQRIKGHVLSKHKIDGFLCPSRGCLVRASTLSEIGLHHLYCHEKSKEWWVPFLYESGGDSEFLM